MTRLLPLAVALVASGPALAQAELLGTPNGVAVSATRSATYDAQFQSGRVLGSGVAAEVVIGRAYLAVGRAWTGIQGSSVGTFAAAAGGFIERDLERGSAVLASVAFQIGEGGDVRLLTPQVSASYRVTQAGQWELAPQASAGFIVDISRRVGGEVGPFVSGGLALSIGTAGGRFAVAPSVTVFPTAEVGVVSLGISGGLALGL